MASTKWCLQCGGEFLASVEVCPDCELPLVDERPVPALPDADDEGGEIEYDLAEWAGEARVMLEQLLEGDGVPHAWQGATLLVPAAFEARADNHIDHVEVATRSPLDPDAEQVAYDLSDWTDDMRDRLEQRLLADAVPFAFDIEGDLVVLLEDEARVEAMIDDVEYPDALPVDGDGDGPGTEGDGADADDVDAGELLSDLFVAADRLMHDARDHEGVLSLVDAAARAEVIRLPYGFDPDAWRRIVARAAGLRAAFEGEVDEPDEVIEERARELRAELRPLV